MGQYNLNRLFHPRHIAVIGAGEKPDSIGSALMTNLMDGGYTGKILPVNSKYRTIHGLPAFGSVLDLEAGIDLALIATPIHTVPDIVRACVDRSIGGAVVISAGGKEIGAQGREIEDRIAAIAYGGGLRIVGPNCMGIICAGSGMNASFASEMPPSGRMAFVSQSGGICGAILDLAFKEHIGFSHFVSIGSMLDVDFGDMIDYLGNDPAVSSILLYIESLSHFRKFMSAARSVSRVKPIIALKAGQSPAGARAAASHTGALAGEDPVYDAAFKRAGIVRVDTIEELFDCAELMAKQPRPKGPKLAIITNSGGPGVMATDALARSGKEPATLDAQTIAKLDAVLPRFWSRNNPIDTLGDATAVCIGKTLDICLNAPDIDGLLLIFIPQAMTDPVELAEAIVAATRNEQLPVLTCWMGGKHIEKAVEISNVHDIPTYETPERAVKAFLRMAEYARNLETLMEIPPRIPRDLTFDCHAAEKAFAGTRTGWMPESDCRAILSAYGFPVIPTETAASADEAVRLGRKLGYPVVMKLLSPDISHKTEASGVCLDLRARTDLRSAFRRIMASAKRYDAEARIDGVTIQPFIARPDCEILLGAKRDANFGPVILFGMGGIYTEVLKDRAIGLPPMNRLLARHLMQGTRIWSLLRGFRNLPPADLEGLEEMILRLSQMLIDFPQIAELDMNPVLIRDGKPVVVDARVLVSETDVPSPMHLVIAPYPETSESQAVTNDGIPLFIRPVKPEDAPLFKDLYHALSPAGIRSRFFGTVRDLTPQMLARFTQIDYDREIAMVALNRDTPPERMLGIARIMGDPDGKKGRFAVLIAESFHGRGIGSALLKTCLSIAGKRGFESVSGIVRKENTGMLELGRKLGFAVTETSDSGAFELVFRL